MTRRTKRWLVAIPVALALLVALFLRTFSAAPLPAVPPYAGPTPSATPPAGMRVVHLPTGLIPRNAAIAYRGGAFSDKRDFTMSALLVKHPRGDVLIDTGFGRNIDAQFASMPWFFRVGSKLVKDRSAADQLAAVGYDAKNLRAILLTHAHWDHVSGVPDLPEVPVWITAEERRFIAEGGTITDIARSIPIARYVDYAFEGGPYLGFPRSHDVHGDGSIVVVPAPGHTPGSVIVFVHLPTGQRLALVGDLAWQREGILEREERPWLTRTAVDHDPAGVRDNLLRMNALAARYPDLLVLPAHDPRPFAQLPPSP